MTTLKPVVSRTGVYGIAIKDQKILLVKQPKGPLAGKWDFPGGGIESRETIEAALQREFCEEVNMTFETMQLFENFTAISEGVNAHGPYDFHQIGLIYWVKGLSPLNTAAAEMEHTWMDFKHLAYQMLSPFVAQALKQINILSSRTEKLFGN